MTEGKLTSPEIPWSKSVRAFMWWKGEAGTRWVVLTQGETDESGKEGSIKGFGGRREPGEDDIQSLARELGEEAGMSQQRFHTLEQQGKVQFLGNNFQAEHSAAWYGIEITPQDYEQIKPGDDVDHVMCLQVDHSNLDNIRVLFTHGGWKEYWQQHLRGALEAVMWRL